MTRRTLVALGAGVLMTALPACSGNTTSPTPTTGPSQARITVSATLPLLSFSPRAGFNFRVTVPATITEAAGLGANINFVRLRQVFAGVEIERSEISSADLIASTGTNRLNASASRAVNLIFDVNDDRPTSGILTFNFTDDRGNALSVDFTITY
jgi:hypothetical protein